MEVLWNQINLQRPPYRPWDVPVNEFDAKQFTQAIDVILQDFETFNVLHAEAALLSRLIYRMKSKFRSDKGLKHMEKVNRALLNYLNMSLYNEYKLLKEYTEVSTGMVSLPPRQTLEYVLVRTQGFAKLFCRIESMSVIAGNFLKSRLHIGQSWTVATIAYGIISRIWVLSRHVIKRSCMWYDILYNYSKIFKIVGIPWLPESYNLPESLSQWLDLSWFNEDLEKIPLKYHVEQPIFNLDKKNKDELNKSIDNLIENTIKTEVQKSLTQQNQTLTLQNAQDSDLGRPISRDHFEKSCENIEIRTKKVVESEVKIKKEKSKTELSIKTEKDLISLLTANSFPGLDKLQWNILRNNIKKFLLKLTKNNTVDVDKKMCKKVVKYVDKWMSAL